MEFVFNRLHENSPTIKVLGRYLAKATYNLQYYRDFAHNFLSTYPGATPHVAKALAQMTIYDDELRARRRKVEEHPCYVQEYK